MCWNAHKRLVWFKVRFGRLADVMYGPSVGRQCPRTWRSFSVHSSIGEWSRFDSPPRRSFTLHGHASAGNLVILLPLSEYILILCTQFFICIQEFVSGTELMKSMIPALFSQLLVFAGFACQAPTIGQLKTKSINAFKGMQVILLGKLRQIDEFDLNLCQLI